MSGREVVVDGIPSLEIATSGQAGVYMEVGEAPTSQAVTVKSTDEDVTVYPDEADYISSVLVEGITGTQEITTNGTHDVLDDKQVVVNVQPPLQAKTATSNGDVTASAGFYGLQKVTVAIPTYDGSYTVTPTTTAQILATSGKVMTQDVTVEAVEESVKYATGTFAGDGATASVDLNVGFAPDIITITSNLNPYEAGWSGTWNIVIVKGVMLSMLRHDTASTTSPQVTAKALGKDGVDEYGVGISDSFAPRASYSDGVLTVWIQTSNARTCFTSGATYTWAAIKHT